MHNCAMPSQPAYSASRRSGWKQASPANQGRKGIHYRSFRSLAPGSRPEATLSTATLRMPMGKPRQCSWSKNSFDPAPRTHRCIDPLVESPTRHLKRASAITHTINRTQLTASKRRPRLSLLGGSSKLIVRLRSAGAATVGRLPDLWYTVPAMVCVLLLLDTHRYQLLTWFVSG